MGLIIELIHIVCDAILDKAAGEGGQSEQDVIRTAARRNRIADQAREYRMADQARMQNEARR